MDNYHPYDLVPTADYPGSAMLELFNQGTDVHAIHTNSPFFTDVKNTALGLYKAITQRQLEVIPDMAIFGTKLLYFATFGVHDAAYKVVKQQAYNLYESPAEAAIVAALGFTIFNDDAVKAAATDFITALRANWDFKRFKDSNYGGQEAALSNAYHIPQGMYYTYADYVDKWVDLLKAVANSDKIPTITAAAAAIVKDLHFQKSKQR